MPRDLVVLVVEHLAQQEHRALLRRQRLEQDHERERHRLGLRQRTLRPAPVVGDDRLRQPGTDVLLAGRARRLQPIQAQARDDRRQIGLGRSQIGGRAPTRSAATRPAARPPRRWRCRASGTRRRTAPAGASERDRSRSWLRPRAAPSARSPSRIVGIRRPPAEIQRAPSALDSGSRSDDHPRHVRRDETRQPQWYRDRRGAPAASATARTISLKLTGSSSTMS